MNPAQVCDWYSNEATASFCFTSFGYDDVFQKQWVRLEPSPSTVLAEKATYRSETCWILPEHAITRILVESFREVPQVQFIYAQFCADGITIWTILDSYDRQARGQVYDRELAICEHLRIFDFDFRVTSSDIVQPSDLARAGSREIYRRP